MFSTNRWLHSLVCSPTVLSTKRGLTYQCFFPTAECRGFLKRTRYAGNALGASSEKFVRGTLRQP